jgi:SAM-dependent methyltransferase
MSIQEAETVIISPASEIHEDDFIYKYLLDHSGLNQNEVPALYFKTGKASAEMLRDVLRDKISLPPQTQFELLEFASGYGGVTRHLGFLLPEATVTACDIHQQAVDFIIAKIGVNAVISNSRPSAFELDNRFDVVFALSFFSHMPVRTFGPWLKALFRHVKPGGQLMFTTHGEASNRLLWKDTIAFDSHGFYFMPISEQGDIDTSEYGTAICKSKFVMAQVKKYLNSAEPQFIEGLWWGHQDLYIFRKPVITNTISNFLNWFGKSRGV